jgi:hypothetical protein
MMMRVFFFIPSENGGKFRHRKCKKKWIFMFLISIFQNKLNGKSWVPLG